MWISNTIFTLLSTEDDSFADTFDTGIGENIFKIMSTLGNVDASPPWIVS
jgi:hypothetical protein